MAPMSTTTLRYGFKMSIFYKKWLQNKSITVNPQKRLKIVFSKACINCREFVLLANRESVQELCA